MKDRVRIAMLFDFYAPLLTEHQRELVRRYYLEDLSLGEISQDLGISRQAVHDQVARAGSALEEYEEKLSLVAGHLAQRRRLAALKEALESADLARAQSLVQDLLEES